MSTGSYLEMHNLEARPLAQSQAHPADLLIDPDDVHPHGDIRQLIEGLKLRRWPLLTMAMLVVVGLAYSFCWAPVVDHVSGWVTPGDIWSTFRAAHWVGWGDLGSVYGSDTQLVTFPGIAVLLAPVAMVSSGLGLSDVIGSDISRPPDLVGLAGTRKFLCSEPHLCSRSTPWPSESASTVDIGLSSGGWRRPSFSR